MREKFLSKQFITEEEAEEILEIVEDEFSLEDWGLYKRRVEFTCDLSGDV